MDEKRFAIKETVHELLQHENIVICNAKNKVDIIHWN